MRDNKTAVEVREHIGTHADTINGYALFLGEKTSFLN